MSMGQLVAAGIGLGMLWLGMAAWAASLIGKSIKSGLKGSGE